jgi:hypothetical protein
MTAAVVPAVVTVATVPTATTVPAMPAVPPTTTVPAMSTVPPTTTMEPVEPAKTMPTEASEPAETTAAETTTTAEADFGGRLFTGSHFRLGNGNNGLSRSECADHGDTGSNRRDDEFLQHCLLHLFELSARRG